MRIGVRLDTTGAHAVLANGPRVVTAAFAPHTEHPGEALAAVLRTPPGADRPQDTVDSVTWDVSALLAASLTALATPGHDARKGPVAGPVAALRVVPRRPHGSPRAAHPSSLVTSLVTWRGTITGGHDLFGAELAPLDVQAARDCARSAEAAGLTTLAITATGAGACADHEQAIAAQLLEGFPNLRLCLSHQAGGVGLLEREATIVVNAALLDIADHLIDQCEQATAHALPKASCWFASGDGGRIPAKRLRWLPVLGLAASTAAALMGAAALAGRRRALVALVTASTITTGRIDDDLPHVEPDRHNPLDIQLTLPQAAIAAHPAGPATTDTWLVDHNPQPIDVVAVLDEDAAVHAQRLLQAASRATTLLRPQADLAALGAACSEPSAWLDLLVPVSAPEELERIQSQAEQRALTQVATGGAQSERIVSSVASPVGYLSIYRLQIRAAARARTGTGR
ncbi:hypothetical protein [Kitasatospora sp. NPDC085879]|uniref:hypothetical protein n=1 Tax=Kitasatospora sp. NPDC085879 TaxID=3154769 RepID=UPI00342DAA70